MDKQLFGGVDNQLLTNTIKHINNEFRGDYGQEKPAHHSTGNKDSTEVP